MSRFKHYKIMPERRQTETTKEWEELLSGKKLANTKSKTSSLPLIILIGIGTTLIFTNEDFATNLYHNISKQEMNNNIIIPPTTEEYNLPVEVENNNKIINFNSEPAVLPNFTLHLNSMEIEDIIEDENDNVSIYLDLKNSSNQIQHINYMNFEVYDDLKNKMDYDIKSFTENLLDNNLEIGQQISGKLSFKIRNQINKFYLVFKDPNPQNGYIYFTLSRYV